MQSSCAATRNDIVFSEAAKLPPFDGRCQILTRQSALPRIYVCDESQSILGCEYSSYVSSGHGKANPYKAMETLKSDSPKFTHSQVEHKTFH